MRSLLLLAYVTSCYSAEAGPGPECSCAQGSADDASHTEPVVAEPAHDQLKLTKAKYADLPGWTDDKVSEAVPAFLTSCAKLATLADDAPVGADGHGGVAKE